jgi:Uma2 family endonuclease
VDKTLREFPEIVLEVIDSSPLLDKLDVYAAMGVSEVWVFKNGAFTLHAFDRETRAYRKVERSALAPSLDFAAVARYAVRTDTPQALREFEREIRSSR